MYMPPHMGSQLASERRREMLAQAQRQHQVRKVAALARASRRAERAERRMRRAARKALRLRAKLSNGGTAAQSATRMTRGQASPAHSGTRGARRPATKPRRRGRCAAGTHSCEHVARRELAHGGLRKLGQVR